VEVSYVLNKPIWQSINKERDGQSFME
jgi:hypothetical protein